MRLLLKERYQRTAMKKVGTSVQPIALRVTDPLMYSRIEQLSSEQNLSLNMTVNMLLGYAFNQVDKENKEFVSRVVFETK